MTKKHDDFQDEFHAMSAYLTEHRAFWRCEIKAEGCIPSWLLPAHHIIRRGKGGTNDPSNLLIPCVSCGDHSNYQSGIKGMTIEEQFALAEKLNLKYGIPNKEAGI